MAKVSSALDTTVVAAKRSRKWALARSVSGAGASTGEAYVLFAVDRPVSMLAASPALTPDVGTDGSVLLLHVHGPVGEAPKLGEVVAILL